MAGNTLELYRRINQFFCLSIFLINFLKLFYIFKALGEPALFHSLSRVEWDQFCKLIAEGIGDAQSAPGVSDCRARGHSAESYYGGDFVSAVFISDIIQNLVPASIRKIQINIRRGDAIRIHKPFEYKIIGNWINICNSQHV